VVQAYWKPIYKYLRIKWNLSSEDAQDATQGFLTLAFEKRYFEAYDPSKGRFRTFARVCVDRFVAKERKAALAIKRGGSTRLVSLDFESAEGELRQIDVPDPKDLDELFRREFVRELFAISLNTVRDELHAEGKELQFRVFERYDLEPAEHVTYATVAGEFEIPPTQVTNYLAAVRRRFRTCLLRTLQAASPTESDYQTDARELLGVEVP
jgi:DNA-directed RNA polymerase specialized sigma24 family protein